MTGSCHQLVQLMITGNNPATISWIPIFLLELVPGGIDRRKAVVRVHLRAGHSQSAQNLGQDELFQFDLPCDASVSQSGGLVPWKCRTLVRRIGKTASTLVAYERNWRMNVENGFLQFGSKWDFLSLKHRVADPIHNFVTCSYTHERVCTGPFRCGFCQSVASVSRGAGFTSRMIESVCSEIVIALCSLQYCTPTFLSRVKFLCAGDW